jgi:hypothetical protein
MSLGKSSPEQFLGFSEESLIGNHLVVRYSQDLKAILRASQRFRLRICPITSGTFIENSSTLQVRVSHDPELFFGGSPEVKPPEKSFREVV